MPLPLVVYRSRKGEFVYVIGVSHVMKEDAKEQPAIWSPPLGTVGRRISDVEACLFYLRTQQQVPSDLEHCVSAALELEQAIADGNLNDHSFDAVPRPVEFWLSVIPLQSRADVDAHAANVIDLVTSIQLQSVLAIQELRRTPSGPVSDALSQIADFAKLLFLQFTVHPEKWWGSRDVVPPEAADLLDLKWPHGSKSVSDCLRELRKLLSMPLAGVVAYRIGVTGIRHQNLAERALGIEALRGFLPEWERLTVQLFHAIATFKSESAHSEVTTQGKKLAKPTKQDAWLYKISVFMGVNQDRLGELYMEAFGKTISQGTISRRLKVAENWLSANKLLPEIGLVPSF